MKVAVSSTGNHLDSLIDPRFGRCAYFVFVETEDMSYEACENPGMSLGGGAGIQSAQFVASKGARAVITGNCGPNAAATLSAAGLDLILGQVETVRQALEDYKNGHLKTSTEPNVADHYGMGGSRPGAGMGRGRGMGRGMAMTSGMGRGRGMAAGMGSRAPSQSGHAYPPRSGQGELRSLEDQASYLSEQLKSVQERIRAFKET
jgi:predicted Fe-Mo cluster-binding NifX family protein